MNRCIVITQVVRLEFFLIGCSSRRVNGAVEWGTKFGRSEMSIIGWIVLGLIAGFIASKIVSNTGQGLFLDIVLGVVGAIVGGFLFDAVGAAGVTGFNLWSMFVAVIGAIVVLLIYHAAFRRAA